MLVFHSPEPNQGIGWANKANMPGDCDRSPSPGQREREIEILPTPEGAARTLAEPNCCRVGLRAREHTGLPQPLASKQASKREMRTEALGQMGFVTGEAQRRGQQMNVTRLASRCTGQPSMPLRPPNPKTQSS